MLCAQDALNRVTPTTEVRSVAFRFVGKQSLDEDVLRQKIALTGQGSMVWLRRVFGFLPFVPPVGAHTFDPIEMERDVLRLRNYCQRSGYPKVDVHYEVQYQAKGNAVRVTYVIAEGPPLEVASLDFTTERGPVEPPPNLARSWLHFVRVERKDVHRAGENERRALADSTVRWFRAHGYPFATARTISRVDSAANRATVTVQADPGTRARIRR